MQSESRYLPIVLLIVALLLFDDVAYVGIAGQTGLVYALAMSQACLLGIWAGIGRTRTAIRLPIALALLGILIRFGSVLVVGWPWYLDVAVGGFLVLTAGLVAFVVLAARLRGLTRLVRVGDMAGGSSPSGPFQFTISEIFQAVASCGASLAILKALYPPVELLRQGNLTIDGEFSIVLVISGLLAAWTVLNARFRMWQLGVLVTATWVGILAMSFTTPYSWDGPLGVWIWFYLALVTCALFACRAGGYRIVGKHTDGVALASEGGQCEREATTEKR